MKKFNPDEELNKMKEKNKLSNISKLQNAYVPILVVACSCLAMIGVTFSAKLTVDDINYYTVKIDIINGNEKIYEKRVPEGAYRDVIFGNGTFGSINCLEGELEYDPLTSAVSNVYVNKDITCILSFMDDGTKNLSLDNLGKVNDNTGISSYYKADSTNNYVKIKDMLFRIVRVNGDGSIRLVLNDVVLSSTYSKNKLTVPFTSSMLKVTLNNWFKANFSDEEYLVMADFDNNSYEEEIVADNLIDYTGYYRGWVGTLSVREVMLMTDGIEGANFLNTPYGMYLMNVNGYKSAYYYKNGKVLETLPNVKLSVRPVINIKNVELSGLGTMDNPYVIEE